MTALATRTAATALEPAERPARAGALSATLTFGARALLRVRRVPEQMADAILIPIVFTLLFTYLFGGAMAGSPGRYLTYLLPGTLVMTVLMVTVYAGLGLATDRSRGALDRLWTTLGLLLRTPTTVTVLSFVVQFPLTFASNAFVDPATMPGWLRAFVSVNPVSHLVTAERGLLSGTVAAGQLAWVFGACAGLVAVFAPLTMLLYRRLR